MTRSPWPLAIAGIAVLAMLAHAAHGTLNLGGSGLDTFFHQWVYDGVMLAAASLCLARAALVRADRWAWLAMGAGLLCYFGGEVYWSLRLSGLEEPPYPSPADALYLGFYPFSYVGLVLLARARMREFRASLWLDGVIGALVVAAVGTAWVIPPVLDATDGDLVVVATTIAYPLGDILLVAIAVGILALTGWRSAALVVLAAGFAIGGMADSAYLVRSAEGTYVEGGPIDTAWLMSTLALGAAALLRSTARERMRIDGWGMMAVPGTMAVVAFGLLVYGSLEPMGLTARVLTYGALLAILVRAGMTFGENIRLLTASRHEALTDALTGLRNRRSLMADLADLAEQLERVEAGERRVLVLFDLDGFKQYNDTFGHPAGDALLARLGHELDRAVRPYGRAYRMGGDEFCALVHDADSRDEALAAACAALEERGEGFAITTSYGMVAMPDDTAEPPAALQLADQRMYAQKDSRRASARRQARDVLLRVLQERQPALGDHTRAVSEHAVAVGRAMGLDNEDLDVLARASELHDIGKMAIPDAILDKPGPLDADEHAFMRRHPAIGDRILSAAPALRPVARIVRASHEHQDGSGYPDGLAGDRIPLGARIIAVCDAYDAMVSDRAYRQPMTPEAALAKLREEAGTRFDPAVVGAFADCVRSAPAPDTAHAEAR
jgi:diguanylate cyclase (GGDEF)-like protein